jgi:hypothetical protein
MPKSTETEIAVANDIVTKIAVANDIEIAIAVASDIETEIAAANDIEIEIAVVSGEGESPLYGGTRRRVITADGDGQTHGDGRTHSTAWWRSSACTDGDVAGGNSFGPAITGDRCDDGGSPR